MDSIARKPIRFWIGVIIGIVLVFMQLGPKVLMHGTRDAFDYDRDSKEEAGTFIPYLYIQRNTSRSPVLLFRVDRDRLPHHLVMLQYDQTYLKTDQGFVSFVLDEFYLEFEDGSRVECVDPNLPIKQRSYAIRESGKLERKVFKGVINKHQGFTIHIRGTANREDGTDVPFQSKKTYDYNGKRRTFHTILDEWASV